MSSLPKSYYTPEQYLELEHSAESKSEYFSSQMFAMAGASPRHVAITVNVASELRTQLRGRPCQTFASDLRVKVPATGLYAYPDIVIACGDLQFDELDANTLTNPSVIVEVLSPSTELYDRGEKFIHYRKIATLTEYVLVSQDKPYVEHFLKQPDGHWLLFEAEGLGAKISLPSIECEIGLTDIYDRIIFTALETSAPS